MQINFSLVDHVVECDLNTTGAEKLQLYYTNDSLVLAPLMKTLTAFQIAAIIVHTPIKKPMKM